MFESNIKEMKGKLLYIKALGEIYTHLEDEMNWNCLEYHNADDSHDAPWFTVPDEAEYIDDMKAQYKAYKDVLYHIRVLVGEM